MKPYNTDLPIKIILEKETCRVCGNFVESSDRVCSRCKRTLNDENLIGHSKSYALWLALRTAVKTGVAYVGKRHEDCSTLVDVIPITNMSDGKILFKVLPDTTITTRGDNYENV